MLRPTKPTAGSAPSRLRLAGAAGKLTGGRLPQVPDRGRPRVYVALLLVYFFWGSTYLGIRIANESLPPLLAAGTRFALASAALALIAGARHEWREHTPGRRQVAASAMVGVLLFAGGNGLVVLAELRIPSGVASLVVSISPVLVALISYAAFRQPPRVVQVAGMALGFAGIAVLAHPGATGAYDPLGLLEAFAGALCWSTGSVVASRADLPRTPLVAASLEMAVGGSSLILLGLVAGEASGGVHLDAASGRSLAALAYLVVFGSLLAFTAYSWLVRSAPLSLVFTYVYVNPVVAVLLGALLLGERISGSEVLGGAIILVGVATIVTGQAVAGRRRRRAPVRRD